MVTRVRSAYQRAPTRCHAAHGQLLLATTLYLHLISIIRPSRYTRDCHCAKLYSLRNTNSDPKRKQKACSLRVATGLNASMKGSGSTHGRLPVTFGTTHLLVTSAHKYSSKRRPPHVARSSTHQAHVPPVDSWRRPPIVSQRSFTDHLTCYGNPCKSWSASVYFESEPSDATKSDHLMIISRRPKPNCIHEDGWSKIYRTHSGLIYGKSWKRHSTHQDITVTGDRRSGSPTNVSAAAHQPNLTSTTMSR